MDERLEDHTVVASISGGKDSAAMSLWLAEQGIDHERVFADTGWEADETYQYIDEVLEPTLGQIHRVRADLQMEELAIKKGMFPSRLRRWCTDELKVKPINAFIERYKPKVVSAIGIRAGESEARSKLPEWEWSNEWDCWLWRPLINWTLQDVIDIHNRNGLSPNPLYMWGAERVGCWPCIFARKSEVRLISERDERRIDRLRMLENKVQDEARARYKARGETFKSKGHHPPTFFNHRDEGDGYATMWPIDKVVKWSKTSHGGKQLELFALESDGCMRWGLCDTIADD